MRLKTLNGAPLCEHLDFSPGTLLQPEECEQALKAFLDPQSPAAVKWRRLAARDARLRSGWSQPYLPAGSVSHEGLPYSPAIPQAADSFVSIAEETTDVHDFLEHSLILHDTLLSSQINPDVTGDETVSSSSFLTASFEATPIHPDTQQASELADPVLCVPHNLTILPLAAVPTAEQLQALHPQTPTPTIICVLTSRSEPREVLVKKGGYRMHLVEITAADETRSGFQVTFWFRPPSHHGPVLEGAQERLRTTIEQARVGDILLLRNIALSSFRDHVHGQSLNASITRARTTAAILQRADGPSSLAAKGLPPTVEEKLSRVKKWSSNHIVPDYVSSRKRKRDSDTDSRGMASSDANEDHFPPDTMET